MIILGIADSHESHACILKDGELVAFIAEERLSRLKGDLGYPKQAIDKVLEISEVDPKEIDIVVFAGRLLNVAQILNKKTALFSTKDWVKEQHIFWKPQFFDNAVFSNLDEYEMFKDIRKNVEEDPYASFFTKLKNSKTQNYQSAINSLRIETVENHLNIDRNRIQTFRHEDCHKIYGFYSAPFRTDKALVLTVEGMGDDSSATYSEISNDGTVTEFFKSNEVNVGRLYRYVTLLLGMKPLQHEYKVMGLAPYGNSYNGQSSLDIFRKINAVMGVDISNKTPLKDLYFSLKEALEGERFDGIAWGLQTYLEELLCEWTANICKKHDNGNVIFSGGVAQNIKACKSLIDLPEVENFWSGPISGDGSLAIGAVWLAHLKSSSKFPIRGLDTVYLGGSFSNSQIEEEIIKSKSSQKFKIIDNISQTQIVDWLIEGKIISRFSGRSELGQRALGNRSIIADARNFEVLEKINQKIKFRDFWMPFTPSILYEDVDNYVINKKNVYSPYMTMAFDLKPGMENEIPAAIHPADKTVRPQMLKRQDNQTYHDLISEFKDKTGTGALLNTSFNLHGEPIVENPADAISTFERSNLDVLILENKAIIRGDS